MRHLSQESHARAATRACQGWSTTQPRVGREKRYAHTTTRNYSRRSDVVIPYDARLWKYKSAAATSRSNWQILPDVAAQRRLGFCEVEDFDAVLQDAWEPLTADDALFRRVHRATQELLVRRGADIRYARRLAHLMRAVGLEHVSIEARFALGAAAQPGVDAIRANFVQTRAELIAAELVTADDVDRALDLLDNAEFPVVPLMVSARGQKAR